MMYDGIQILIKRNDAIQIAYISCIIWYVSHKHDSRTI